MNQDNQALLAVDQLNPRAAVKSRNRTKFRLEGSMVASGIPANKLAIAKLGTLLVTSVH
jgi:hypothetical protein